MLDVLWQHGLLGYDAGDDIRFSATLDANDFHLPLDRRGYVLHPCLGHALPVRATGLPVMGACHQRRGAEVS